MTRRRLRPNRAFTLAELLVSTTVVVVLIPIVLPALSGVGEQARIEKCLSNLRQLMSATNIYLSDYDDRFPLAHEGYHCSWAFGGKTSDDVWLYSGSGGGHIEVQNRPINPYILGARIQPDLRVGGDIVERTEIPPLRCPSDSITHQHLFNDPDPGGAPSPISSYDDVGTSYHFNRGALKSVNYCGSTNPWSAPGTWSDICRALMRDVRQNHSSTFTVFYEDPMDWGFGSDRIRTYGSHGEFSKHSCGYLDGHADYLYRDTRTYGGVGWAAINPGWVKLRGQPLPHPVYYTSLWKNCNPVLEN